MVVKTATDHSPIVKHNFRMKKVILILQLALLLSACDKDAENISFSSNAFSFVETQSFDDYFGESKTFIYDLNNNQKINIGISTSLFGHSKWVNSGLIYSDGYSVIKYNPSTKESTTLFRLEGEIQSFDYFNQQIVYSDFNNIFLIDLSSGSTTQITDDIDGEFRFPKFSPDGSSILFNNWIRVVKEGDTAPTLTTQFLVYHSSSDSFQAVEMFDEFASPNQRPNWSPSGKAILYEQYQAVFTYDLTSETLTRITSENEVATNPSFSTDGKMISYFSSDYSDNGNDWQSFLTIYNLETQSRQILNDVYSYDAAWNSASNIILFCTDGGIHSFDFTTSELKDVLEVNNSTFVHSTQWIN